MMIKQPREREGGREGVRRKEHVVKAPFSAGKQE